MMFWRKRPTAFVHVGYPKTGSTYLQERFFRSHPQINNAMLKPDFANLVYALSLTTNSADTLADVRRKGFGDHLLKGQVNVISSEGMTDPDKIVPRGGAKNHLRHVIEDFSEILRSYGFEPHFLVVTRRQPDALISRYAEKYRSFVPMDPRFEEPANFFDCLRHADDLLQLYDYKGIVDLLKEAKVQFSVLTYEQFASEHERFIRNLASILDVNLRYALAISSGWGKRVSPKLSTYEYFAYYESRVEDKLDVPHSIALDKKAKFCETEEFARNDRPFRRHVNYKKLAEMKNEPVPYREISEFEKEDAQIVRLTTEQVEHVKGRFKAGNQALDEEFSLGLRAAGYY